MFAGVDPGATRPGRRIAWLIAAVLAVAAAAVAVRLLVASGEPSRAGRVQDQVARRMQTELERRKPADHGHADHDASVAAGARTVCGVKVYGYEPAGARTLREVRTVYGYHLCGVAEPGRPWDWAVKLSGPLVMDLASRPPAIQVAAASEGVSFRERVRQLIPQRYQEQAYQELLDEQTMRDLRRRYDRAAGV